MARREMGKILMEDAQSDKQMYLETAKLLKDTTKLIQMTRRFTKDLIAHFEANGFKVVVGRATIAIPVIADSEVDLLIEAISNTPIEGVETMLNTIELKTTVESNDTITVWNIADAIFDASLEEIGFKQMADSIIFTFYDLVNIYVNYNRRTGV